MAQPIALPTKTFLTTTPAPEALEAALQEACGAKRPILHPDGTPLGEGWLVGAYRHLEAPPAELADLDPGVEVELSIWAAHGRRWVGVLVERHAEIADGAEDVFVCWNSTPGDLAQSLANVANGTITLNALRGALTLRNNQLPEEIAEHLQSWAEYLTE